MGQKRDTLSGKMALGAGLVAQWNDRRYVERRNTIRNTSGRSMGQKRDPMSGEMAFGAGLAAQWNDNAKPDYIHLIWISHLKPSTPIISAPYGCSNLEDFQQRLPFTRPSSPPL